MHDMLTPRVLLPVIPSHHLSECILTGKGKTIQTNTYIYIKDYKQSNYIKTSHLEKESCIYLMELTFMTIVNVLYTITNQS